MPEPTGTDRLTYRGRLDVRGGRLESQGRIGSCPDHREKDPRQARGGGRIFCGGKAPEEMRRKVTAGALPIVRTGANFLQ